MLELKPFETIKFVEVIIRCILVITSIIVLKYFYKMQHLKSKTSKMLFIAMAIISFSMILKVLREFFVESMIREMIFEISGEICILIGYIIGTYGILLMRGSKKK